MQKIRNACFEIYIGLMKNIVIPVKTCYGSYLGGLFGGELKSFPEITLETSPQRIEQLAYLASCSMADRLGLSAIEEIVLNGRIIYLIAINYYLSGLRMRNRIKKLFLKA